MSSRRVPPEKRKRAEASCDKCKSRKQKCRKDDGQDACRYCLAHGIECQTTQPRKKRLYGSVEGLGSRLAMLESLLKGMLPQADLSSLDSLRNLGEELGIPMDPHGSDQMSNGSNSITEESSSLLPDQQGQAQYIGPASTFTFYRHLRALMGQTTMREFVLFGSNAADEPLQQSESEKRDLGNEPPNLDSLLSVFFQRINPDFPVLHEASFREGYQQWVSNPESAEPAWFCSFLCVLLLARPVARLAFDEAKERAWWRRVQTLLPVVLFTSSLESIQALMLAAAHLHNTNHRDACWSLTGTAVRIAVGIGLHQDKVDRMHTQLTTEMRKRVWWTLCEFEYNQVSSYDRPSAIQIEQDILPCADADIIGMAEYYPSDYCAHASRLVLHLGSACLALKKTKLDASKEMNLGPLSPIACAMRDLDRWRTTLPAHLRLDAAAVTPALHQRPLMLLHAKFHYATVVLCRYALLTRTTMICKDGLDSANMSLNTMADTCVMSGRALAQILLRLDEMGKFDHITWWDIYYTLASASILLLDLICTRRRRGGIDGAAQSLSLLSRLAELATKHRQDPHMPGTMEKWASLIPELLSMAESVEINAGQGEQHQHRSMELLGPPSTNVQGGMGEGANFLPHVHLPHPLSSASGNTGYHLTDNDGRGKGRFTFGSNTVPPTASGPSYSNRAHDYARPNAGPQMNVMDFPISNISEWNWADFGGLAFSEGGTMLQGPE
ncbi:hypothetical protein M011DRAFT_465618 [Sporormia fimetaria CBS 119925]|uniref:Zn(2)-C6 fungal-type domain-containing protein n=1 Tax=Sporormia fimetaria CBS 119925 TaxID=1340428 RepID=A0A6A6VJI3_9PLEO|nr:hypothetical protein M011DRAFT_465618 [Sporormia fimetaria CBS 119925]